MFPTSRQRSWACNKEVLSAAALPELDEMLKKAGGRLGDVKQYASYPEAYQDLVNGRTDYVINTVVTVASLVREKPDVFEMGKPVSRVGLPCLGSRRRATSQLLEFINNFLAEQRKNATMSALREKWLRQVFFRIFRPNRCCRVISQYPNSV